MERLFELYYASVLAYALRRSPRPVAEDVASETFVVAFRRIEDVPEQALPWLYGVARRVLANERRSQSRRDRLKRALQAVSEPSWAESRDGEGGVVLAAIAGLPERERKAVMLTAWEGLSGAEAAVAAGCTRVALRARLYRARRRLAELIAGDVDGPVPGTGRVVAGTDESRDVVERSRS